MRFARLAWSFHVRDGVWSGSSRGLCASGRERLGAILARVDVSEGGEMVCAERDGWR